MSLIRGLRSCSDIQLGRVRGARARRLRRTGRDGRRETDADHGERGRLNGPVPARRVRSRDRGRPQARAREALRTVGIEHLADRKITALSGGQRQRTYIARALAGEAELLVLDEPTVGVDAESVDAFFELLDGLVADGMTVLLVEHDIGAVRHRTRLAGDLSVNREVYFDGDPVAFAESDALDRAYGTNVRRGGGGIVT